MAKSKGKKVAEPEIGDLRLVKKVNGLDEVAWVLEEFRRCTGCVPDWSVQEWFDGEEEALRGFEAAAYEERRRREEARLDEKRAITVSREVVQEWP